MDEPLDEIRHMPPDEHYQATELEDAGEQAWLTSATTAPPASEINANGLANAPFLGPMASRNRRMAYSISIVTGIFFFGLVAAPKLTIIIMCALVALGWLPVIYGAVKKLIRKDENAAAALPDEALPLVTILIPLYQEANMLKQISEMLAEIDYPAERMDCLILLEQDDYMTKWQSLYTAWPSFARILTVPRGTPQTKARACNYGLQRSFGDIIVVYDAEDMPFPSQIREAAERFHAADKNLTCLQAPLLIHTEGNIWLQQQFALEYGLLFTFILPSLSAAMSCLPLGGSSNYFRRDALIKVGGWDAHNLTEDAELAIRMAGYGYRIETLSQGTLENAPHEWRIWHLQRTRWQSGHIQIMHSYGAHIFENGFSPSGGFQWRGVMLAYIAILLVRLISGPLLMVSLIIALSPLAVSFSPLLFGAATAFHIAYSLVLFSRCRRGTPFRNLFLVLTHPLYWIATCPAQINALWRMATGQLGWLKSPHQTYTATAEEKSSHYQ